MAFLSTGLTKISASSGNYNDEAEKDPKIMEGYRPSTYTVGTGTTIEHFYYAGNHFSRVAVIYETLPCCTPTGNKMEGCSAPVICPTS